MYIYMQFQDRSSRVFVLHKMKVIVEGRFRDVRATGDLEERGIGVDRFARIETATSSSR